MPEILNNKYVIAAVAFVAGNALGYAMYSPSDETKQIGTVKKKKDKKNKKNKEEGK